MWDWMRLRDRLELKAAVPELERSRIAGDRIRELRKGVTLSGATLRSSLKRVVSETVRSGCFVFALHWCFENEATAETDAMLTVLQNRETSAFVPGIFQYEILNGLGKGVTRGRLDRNKAVLLWPEMQTDSFSVELARNRYRRQHHSV